MKKAVLIGLLIATMMWSCEKVSEEGGLIDESGYFRTYKYRNHTYVRFIGEGNFVIHDPGCECKNAGGVNDEE